MTCETRERILQCAARLFHEQGYAATGVSTILREAGVNSGSLYHFFPSKDDLLRGVLEWYLEHLGPRIMAPIEAEEPDPVKRVFRLFDWYRGFLEENGCRLGCPVGNLALEVSDTHPEVREMVDRNFRNWTAHLERWLVEAGDRLPDDCDRRALASFMLTVMEGAVMQSRTANSLAPFDASVAELRRYFRQLQRAAARGTVGTPALAQGA
ncbi:MAG: TetR/AcrR family transcriptional regulator [Xanthomonadales bacterium]|nr:TetR/AcrR family transcriptional regulator [Xanthomonadales bacterium]